MTALENIKVVTEACRQGLQSLANQPSSNFKGFPNGSCGLSADIVGRILYERLGVEGMYVDAKKHARLKPNQSHAWYEVDGYIIDITYDQFSETGLTGWVFKGTTDWHAQFTEVERREGFCMPDGWPAYPFDGYSAAMNAAINAGSDSI